MSVTPGTLNQMSLYLCRENGFQIAFTQKLLYLTASHRSPSCISGSNRRSRSLARRNWPRTVDS